jgi:hypothetical protein
VPVRSRGFAERRGALAHRAVVERRLDPIGIRCHGAVWQRLQGKTARSKEHGGHRPSWRGRHAGAALRAGKPPVVTPFIVDQFA